MSKYNTVSRIRLNLYQQPQQCLNCAFTWRAKKVQNTRRVDHRLIQRPSNTANEGWHRCTWSQHHIRWASTIPRESEMVTLNYCFCSAQQEEGMYERAMFNCWPWLPPAGRPVAWGDSRPGRPWSRPRRALREKSLWSGWGQIHIQV